MNTNRKTGEHLFGGGIPPHCVTCGCDEDDAYVGGEECTYVEPEAHFRLTLSLSVNLSGIEKSEIKDNLHQIVRNAMSNGTVTGATPAIVEEYECEVVELI